MIPLGQATEIVVFGAGCAGTCDLRTVYLAGGSLILDETGTGGTCPGRACRPGPLELGRGNLADVVVGGTGIYEGATGTLTGTVRLAGKQRATCRIEHRQTLGDDRLRLISESGLCRRQWGWAHSPPSLVSQKLTNAAGVLSEDNERAALAALSQMGADV